MNSTHPTPPLLSWHTFTYSLIKHLPESEGGYLKKSKKPYADIGAQRLSKIRMGMKQVPGVSVYNRKSWRQRKLHWKKTHYKSVEGARWGGSCEILISNVHYTRRSLEWVSRHKVHIHIDSARKRAFFFFQAACILKSVILLLLGKIIYRTTQPAVSCHLLETRGYWDCTWRCSYQVNITYSANCT